MKLVTQSLLAVAVVSWQGCAMTMPAHLGRVTEPAPPSIQSAPSVTEAPPRSTAWQYHDRRTAATVPEIDRPRGQSGN
jgi:hypothetical protein